MARTSTVADRSASGSCPDSSDCGRWIVAPVAAPRRSPSRDMVGVVMGVEHVGDPQILGVGDARDRRRCPSAGRRRPPRRSSADDVRGTSEIAIQHLPEEQDRILSSIRTGQCGIQSSIGRASMKENRSRFARLGLSAVEVEVLRRALLEPQTIVVRRVLEELGRLLEQAPRRRPRRSLTRVGAARSPRRRIRPSGRGCRRGAQRVRGRARTRARRRRRRSRKSGGERRSPGRPRRLTGYRGWARRRAPARRRRAGPNSSSNAPALVVLVVEGDTPAGLGFGFKAAPSSSSASAYSI